MNSPVIAAASIALFNARNQVLLIQRALPPAKGLWTLPGGRIEPGETVEMAALRELREETGLSAEPAGIAGMTEVIRRDSGGDVSTHFIITTLAARNPVGEAVCSDEIQAMLWVDLDEAAGLDTTEGLLSILARAQAVLTSL